MTVAMVKGALQRGLPSMPVWVLAANPSCAFCEALGGQQVYEKGITIGAVQLVGVACGWQDIRVLVEMHQ